MSHSYFNFNKLRNESDIKAAKEKLKYCMLVQEDMLSKSLYNLRINFLHSLKMAALKTGARIVTMVIMNYLQERSHEK